MEKIFFPHSVIEIKVQVADAPGTYRSTMGAPRGYEGSKLVDFTQSTFDYIGLGDLRYAASMTTPAFAKPEYLNRLAQRAGDLLYQKFMPSSLSSYLIEHPEAHARLALDICPPLRNLPWEVLWHPHHKFLALRGSIFRLSDGPKLNASPASISLVHSEQVLHKPGYTVLRLEDGYHRLLDDHRSPRRETYRIRKAPHLAQQDLADWLTRNSLGALMHVGHTKLESNDGLFSCSLVMDGDSSHLSTPVSHENRAPNDTYATTLASDLGLNKSAPLIFAILSACHTAGFFDEQEANAIGEHVILVERFLQWSKLCIGMQIASDVRTAMLLHSVILSMLDDYRNCRIELTHFDLLLTSARKLITNPMSTDYPNRLPTIRRIVDEINTHGIGLKRTMGQWWVPVMYASNANDLSVLRYETFTPAKPGNSWWSRFRTSMPQVALK